MCLTWSETQKSGFPVLAVEPFLDKYISENVLKKLIKQNIVYELKPGADKDKYIYKDGVPCDYFILILQGIYIVYIYS